MKRVGLFGGSFDPVHNGHRAIAHSFLQSRVIDRLLILPAPYPPHKPAQVQASFAHRMEMLRLAFQMRNDILISDLEKTLSDDEAQTRVTDDSLSPELVRFLNGGRPAEPTGGTRDVEVKKEKPHSKTKTPASGTTDSPPEEEQEIRENEAVRYSRPSYTIETITFLQERFPQTLFYLCMGGDSLASFHTWVRWEEILERVALLVAARPGTGQSGIRTEILEKAIFADHEPVDVSSTEVRKQVKNFSKTRDSEDLPESVQHYIREKRLYEG